MKRSRVMTMTWPLLGATVRVHLLDEDAPTITDLVWNGLPFDSIQGHALISGGMLFATIPVFTLVRENVRLLAQMGIGAVYYAGGSQNLGVIYGPITEPEGHSVWGQVPEDDWPALQHVGPRCWQNLVAPFGDPATNPMAKQPILVEYRRHESAER